MGTFSALKVKFVVASMVAGFGVVAVGYALTGPAAADTAPPAGTPATVSADPLPTWQINGVVWAQVLVGNTVYATGSFTRARPPGSPAGQNEVVRSNLLAYDITTGNLNTGFNHSLNAQGLALAASPDGTRVYVGGDFTAVDGQSRGHVAAFDAGTGALSPTFHPSVGNQVRALVATATTVYVGGDFTAVGANTRRFAAAFDTSGAITAWNPNADSTVWAMTLSPDRTRMILGGRFANLGGQSRYGLGGVDLSAGRLTSWNASLIVRDAGPNAAITSLSADANRIYGTGYVFGSGGNVEGRFSIDASGNLLWINDCHGDSYSAAPIGGVLYSVSHAHFCGNMGAFPETDPRTFHRALAETVTDPTCRLTADHLGYASFTGIPCTKQLDWYPTVDLGTYTGQYQGAWSVTGNANYVVLGGEFPRVNGVAQQGLVRFAVSSIAPNKVAPVSSSALTPTATNAGSGVRLSFTPTYDLDNGVLTYSVYRSGTSAPVGSVSADTRFWRLGPNLSVTDSAPPNGTYTYVVVARDAFNNARTSGASNSVTVTGGNAAPTARLTASCTQLSCSFDGSASSDSDGSVVGWSWNFGDGTSGSGATTTHSYQANGTYTVTLTVTDNAGATGQSSAAETVSSGAANGVFASDTFNRTVTNGLGTADLGGAWTAVSSAADLSVSPGAARLNLSAAGTTCSAVLGSTSSSTSVTTARFSVSAVGTGNGTYFSLAGRRLDATHEYRATAHVLPTGVVQVYITKLDGSSSEVSITSATSVTGLSYTAGSDLSIKFSVALSGGVTSMGMKVWAGANEPATWQSTGTDSSASLQSTGSVGIRAYLSGSSTSAPVAVLVKSFTASSQ